MPDYATVAPRYIYQQQQQNNTWLHFDTSSKKKYYEKLTKWLQLFTNEEIKKRE